MPHKSLYASKFAAYLVIWISVYHHNNKDKSSHPQVQKATHLW